MEVSMKYGTPGTPAKTEIPDAPAPALESVTQTVGDVTIDANHWKGITLTALPSGKKAVSIGVDYWAANSSAFWIFPYGSGTSAYIVGAQGTTISQLKIRIWYI